MASRAAPSFRSAGPSATFVAVRTFERIARLRCRRRSFFRAALIADLVLATLGDPPLD
jgi:hypothetical protein